MKVIQLRPTSWGETKVLDAHQNKVPVIKAIESELKGHDHKRGTVYVVVDPQNDTSFKVDWSEETWLERLAKSDDCAKDCKVVWHVEANDHFVGASWVLRFVLTEMDQSGRLLGGCRHSPETNAHKKCVEVMSAGSVALCQSLDRLCPVPCVQGRKVHRWDKQSVPLSLYSAYAKSSAGCNEARRGQYWRVNGNDRKLLVFRE
jgi:hypothetical protein